MDRQTVFRIEAKTWRGWKPLRPLRTFASAREAMVVLYAALPTDRRWRVAEIPV